MLIIGSYKVLFIHWNITLLSLGKNLYVCYRLFCDHKQITMNSFYTVLNFLCSKVYG